MKHIILLLLGLLITPVSLHSQCYELIWSEEFDYTGFPNPDVWTFEVGGGGWGNNELQYYKANDADNAWVEDGKLTITAIQESFGGRNYTSARIITRNKFSVQYGKIEARMRLPYGQGLWPAFWGLGDNYGEVGWPACGEIDIMEFVGGANRDNQVHGTVHWSHNGNHAQHGGSYRLPASSGRFADDFHTVSIVWTPQYIRWYVNDIQFHVIDIRSAGLSAFRQPYFLILNLAVGGNWPGAPNASTVFPQTYEIDYIRVYKNTSDILHEIPVQGDDFLPPAATGRKFSLPSVPEWTYQWAVPEGATIETGQGTEAITVNWGCEEGVVSCVVTGACATYTFTKSVGLKSDVNGPMFVAENQNNVVFYTDSLAETTYEWVFPEGVSVVEGQGTHRIRVNWGTIYEPVMLKITNDCGEYELTYNPIKAGQYPYPDVYSPHIIPGTIQAVDFDYGGPGVSYHDTSNGNTGNGPRQDTNVDTEYNDGGLPNVGWITNGEWLEYTVNVAEDGWYAIDMRLATNNALGGPFSILFNGALKLSGITVSSTGGWNRFVTSRVGIVYLTTQDTLMRLHFNTGGFNLGRIIFSQSTDPTNIRNIHTGPEITVYPVPATDNVVIESALSIRSVSIFDLTGRQIYTVDGRDQRTVSIQTGQFARGQYILQIETVDKYTTNRRISIQR